ncbi:MAG: SCO family protein [Bacteroidota bacterium]
MNRVFQFFAVSVFFIGFPLVSWYYLNQGYEYRMQVINELDQQLGEMPAFQLTDQNGQTISKEKIGKRIVISNFIDLAEVDKSKAYIDKLYKIQDQFDRKDDILFYTYVKSDDPEAVKAFSKSLEIKEEKQWHFLTGSDADMNQFVQQFPFQESGKAYYAGNPTVAIIDTSAVIRHFYDMTDDAQVGQLVVHISNLMPQAPPEEARMKRELEK